MTSLSDALWNTSSRQEVARQKWLLTLRIVAIYLLLSVAAVVMLLPFVWMLSTSLKTPSSVFVYPPEWIPNPDKWTK